jgi:hypothetical protein
MPKRKFKKRSSGHKHKTATKGKKKNILRLCSRDQEGSIPKTVMTIDNFKELKNYVQSIIDLDPNKSYSYRQYCKIIESFIFKQKRCGGDVCCQAITEDGTRCKRGSSIFTSIDITAFDKAIRIPKKIRPMLLKSLGPEKVLDLELMTFANSCCFLCWQHAAIYAIEGSTYLSNLAYYSTHPEALFSIFFKEVKVRKVSRLLTYYITVSKPRTRDEIIKLFYKTTADMRGLFSLYYWGIYIMVFGYDQIKPILLKYLDLDIEKEKMLIDFMTIQAAKTLIEFNR